MKIPDAIDVAIREDLGEGDLTTDAVVPENAYAIGRIIVAEKAILAGARTAAAVFHRIDPALHVDLKKSDGDEVGPADIVLEIRGAARPILKAERVALNFLQRLSGIATLTRKFVDAAENSKVKILDTRKTTPGLRELEKAAVVAGGGVNHRLGLFDMVLVKDNHLAITGGLASFAAALRTIRQKHPNIRIEVETDRLDQVRTFLDLKEIDVVLLDNMTPAQIREAVAVGKNRVKFEASGGVTLKNIRQIAATGVDYISVGALTHSAPAIDFSLDLTPVSL